MKIAGVLQGRQYEVLAEQAEGMTDWRLRIIHRATGLELPVMLNKAERDDLVAGLNDLGYKETTE